jgi:HAD superfamily hydrolase (TIGR01490 family)
MQLALFDLDGTITRRDTLVPYLFHVGLRRPARLLRALVVLPGALFRYLFKGRDRGALKQDLIVAGLAGLSRGEIARYNEGFVKRLLATGLYEEARRQIEQHRSHGDYLVLMSASPDIYVPAVARALGFNETICTGVRWDGMILNGELSTPNRRDEEKVRCLDALRRRHAGSRVIGYGNSASDLAHLVLCDKGYLVNGSHDAIARSARTNVAIGWPGPAAGKPSR